MRRSHRTRQRLAVLCSALPVTRTWRGSPESPPSLVSISTGRMSSPLPFSTINRVFPLPSSLSSVSRHMQRRDGPLLPLTTPIFLSPLLRKSLLYTRAICKELWFNFLWATEWYEIPAVSWRWQKTPDSAEDVKSLAYRPHGSLTQKYWFHI